MRLSLDERRIRYRLGLILNYGLPLLMYPMLLVFFGEAQMLKQASQNRNLKLHDVAARVIETGAEPEDV